MADGPRARSRWIATQLAPVGVLLAPTLLGVVIDLGVRGGTLRTLAFRATIGWLGASFVGAGIWIGMLWALARLSRVARVPGSGTKRTAARAAYAAGFAFVVFPLATAAYGVQIYYRSVFGSYITRDTVRLGVALRGTVLGWLGSWGSQLLPAVAFAAVFTGAMAWAVWRVAADLQKTRSFVPIVLSIACFVLLWRDTIQTSEWMQSPDASLLNGLVGLLHDQFVKPPEGGGLANRKGIALPPLPKRAHRPNVVLIVTESVRADAMCAERSSDCTSRFLDDVIPDRIGLTKATAQSSGTVTSCMVLWTGLGPDADFKSAHETPLLWEVARAAGYRTAYVASQDMKVFGLGAYLKNASIDTFVTSDDLGGVREIHIGAPDERATARMLDLVRAASGSEPFFAVLHLSNTHFPYRTAPELEPFSPHDDSPFPKELEPLKNQYKNAMLLQMRTLAEFYRELRALPAWDDTITLFVSDHGEAFREHGTLFHLNTLYDEEIRVPAWIVAGRSALSADQVSAARAFRDERVFAQDLHATLLDALGAFEARGAFPNGARLHGRSLFRARQPDVAAEGEAGVTLSTTSGVFFDDDAMYGVMSSTQKLLGTDHKSWVCFDVAKDPGEKERLAASACAPPLVALARARFPNVPSSP